MGQKVCLINPRSTKQKVATGVITGIGGVDKFHFTIIPNTWFKIDIRNIFAPDVPLMWENVSADQMKMEDVKGDNVVWD